jgi:hypothetical protein
LEEARRVGRPESQYLLNNHNMPEETDQQEENLEQYYEDAKTIKSDRILKARGVFSFLNFIHLIKSILGREPLLDELKHRCATLEAVVKHSQHADRD